MLPKVDTTVIEEGGLEHICPICNHANRFDIESAILAGQQTHVVAGHYGLDLLSLTKHVRKCSVYLLSLDDFDKAVAEELRSSSTDATAHALTGATALTKQPSIQRQLKIREADHLANVVNEYMMTLKNLGRKINVILENVDTVDGALLAQRVLKKPICDMYVQMGGEIRQTVKTMAELDHMLNGPNENPLTGLAALADAIHASRDLAKK